MDRPPPPASPRLAPELRATVSSVTPVASFIPRHPLTSVRARNSPRWHCAMPSCDAHSLRGNCSFVLNDEVYRIDCPSEGKLVHAPYFTSSLDPFSPSVLIIPKPFSVHPVFALCPPLLLKGASKMHKILSKCT